MRAALARRLATEKVAGGDGSAGVPPDLLEKLGALGYLGAGAPPPGATTGADPKDKIDEYKVLNRLVREGLLKLREKDYPGSVERFRELLRRGVSSFEVHYYLARGLVGMDRSREAIPHFEKALERLPGFAAAWLALAESRLALGDRPGALATLARGRFGVPQGPADPRARGPAPARCPTAPRGARRLREGGGARAQDALLKVQLAEVCRDLGDLEAATERLREAIALDPAPASYWNSLGMVLGAAGDLAEAEKAFREAVSRDGSDAQYAYNLGLALARQGRRAEAAAQFRRSLELKPDFRAPRERLAELRATAAK